MKRVFLFTAAFLFLATTNAQNFSVTKSLDDFFAGIPLQKGFAKWIEYISADSTIGIDSSNGRGFYSSIKKGRTHFPFPDSIQVKILISEEIFYDYMAKPAGQKETILMEGVFSSDDDGKQLSLFWMKQLKQEFKNRYKRHNGGNTEIDYSKSTDANFPDFTLNRLPPGHGINYYVVILEYNRYIRK